MSNGSRILVVDDDADLRWMVEKYLSKHEFAVTLAEDGEKMRAVLEEQVFDLAILDINLPGEDGLSLARYLRANYQIGIIMLSAAAEVFDRVVGLEMGADDYVTKPFEPRELLARVKSVLRRVQGEAEHEAEPDSRVRFGEFTLDLETHQLLDISDQAVSLTSMEFDLLKAFAENPDKVLDRDQLLSLSHNRDWDPFDRSIDIRITRLRRKIEVEPSRPQIIKTVRGAGYIFVSQASSEA
ncbi:MAG: response regulator [Gammaproteobacteria bacterium]|nr:response regulator [Gammaproteobacteria bacterium]